MQRLLRNSNRNSCAFLTEWGQLLSECHWAEAGRYRAARQGSLFHRTDGLHGDGYALCLHCGKADSMAPDATLPHSFTRQDGTLSHKRLRGGKEHEWEMECPGSDSVQTGLSLGVAVRTDVFEIQLLDRQTGAPIDRTAAYSIAVALRRALALHLGVEERELGCATSPSRYEGLPCQSIFLFDTATGGAGYAPQAVDALPELLRQAHEILGCPRGCDAACQACILTYDTQHHVDDLDRKAALEVLTPSFIQAMALPDSHKVFGPDTRLEAEPLTLALRREMQGFETKELRLYLGGEPELWEASAWRLRDELIRLADAGAVLTIVAPEASLVELPECGVTQHMFILGHPSPQNCCFSATV